MAATPVEKPSPSAATPAEKPSPSMPTPAEKPTPSAPTPADKPSPSAPTPAEKPSPSAAAPAEKPSLSEPPPAEKPSPSAATPAEKPSPSTGSTSGTSSEPKIVLGKYILGKLLGRGSFATVYHARAIKDDKSVALKIIDKAKTDASMAPRIIREVQAMWRLDHPHILKIHEVLATKSKIFLVMELAKGGDLDGKLRRRSDSRFPEPIARKYFQQLVSALHFCHQNGVVHRDIKPQNLLLDEDGNIKISDFGLSFVASANHKVLMMKTACGTPSYAAPEVVGRMKGGYDGAKADSWSCGIVLYQMLTGFLPFDDTDLVLMFRKMIRKDFRFPAWVSRPARALIVRLLDPNPATRLGVAQLVETDSNPSEPWLARGPFYSRSVSVGDMVTLGEMTHSDSLSSRISMNAFEIISMSSGLNLAGLFHGKNKGIREEKFTSKEPKEVLVEKLVKSGEKLGYKVERTEDYCVVLSKGRFVVELLVSEMAPGLSLVEFKAVKASEYRWDQDEVQWGELRSGLAHIVVPWNQ